MQRIYVFMGMVASGKSTLAQKFAGQYGLPYYNTDRVRKEIAGLDPVSKCPDTVNQGIYTREFTRKTYQAMLDCASEDLDNGRRGVVFDGSYTSMEERANVRKLAADYRAGCMFILCYCSEDEVRRRLDERARDPEAVSDGRWEIYQVQKKNFVPPGELEESELITMNTAMDVQTLVDKLSRSLNM